MAKTYTWNNTFFKIYVAGGTSGDLMTFKDITDYFKANPLSLDFNLPRGAEELSENNASNWFGQGGIDTPVDDTVDFQVGTASIKAVVASIPSGTAITRVDASDYFQFKVYMGNTSSFVVGNEVMILGTTNFPNVVFRVYSIVTNQYVTGYIPKGCPYVNETGIVGGSLIRPLTLCWNEGKAAGIFAISIANKIRFSAKSDGAGTPKIKAIICRTDTGGAGASFYGMYGKVDYALTSSWQDFEIDIRDVMLPYKWYSSCPDSYVSFARFYFIFDGLSVGETVWVDGVRFVCTDRNPKQIGENSFSFPVGLDIVGWFKDYGFDVRFDMLSTNPKHTSNGPNACGISAIAANLGEIRFGDYTGTKKEGGVFNFNMFGKEEGLSGVYLDKVYCQGITFMAPKDRYGGFSFLYGGGGNYYRNCNWINCLNFYTTDSGSVFESCAWMGGRYFMAFPPDNIPTMNKFTIYGIGGDSFNMSGAWATPKLIKNLKFIDTTSNKMIVYNYSYSCTAQKQEGRKLVNCDLSECASNVRIQIANYGIHAPLTVSEYVSMTFNLSVFDASGTAIENATVTLKDRNNNTLFSITTASNGFITEQIVDILKAYHPNPGPGNVTKNFYFNTPTVDWTYYYPFTLTIEKAGYIKHTDVLLQEGYSTTNEICKNGYSSRVVLKATSILPAVTDVRDSVIFGNESELEGTLDLPAVADVRQGVQFDSLTKTGLLDLPVVANVRKDIQYDNATKTGLLDLPTESDVRLDVQYDNLTKTGLLDLPVESDVRAGIAYDQENLWGILELPSVDDVRQDVGYGAADDSFPPVWEFVGNVVIPLNDDVLEGVVYESTSFPQIGTLVVPIREDVRYGVTFGKPADGLYGILDLPHVSDVREGRLFDRDTKTGELKIPSINDVRNNIEYGCFFDEHWEYVGLLDLPSVNDVRLGTTFDQITKTGLLDLPNIADVEEGVKFDRETKTGTLPIPVLPSEDDVRDGITYGNGISYEGNLVLPGISSVAQGVQYGSNGNELTGELVIAFHGEKLEANIQGMDIDVQVEVRRKRSS